MSTNNPNPGSFEENAEFLRQSIKSHDEQLGKLIEQSQELQEAGKRIDERIDKLTATSERHEREQQRFRKVMNAAFIEWLRGDVEEGSNGN